MNSAGMETGLLPFELGGEGDRFVHPTEAEGANRYLEGPPRDCVPTTPTPGPAGDDRSCTIVHG